MPINHELSAKLQQKAAEFKAQRLSVGPFPRERVLSEYRPKVIEVVQATVAPLFDTQTGELTDVRQVIDYLVENQTYLTNVFFEMGIPSTFSFRVDQNVTPESVSLNDPTVIHFNIGEGKFALEIGVEESKAGIPEPSPKPAEYGIVVKIYQTASDSGSNLRGAYSEVM